MKLHSDEDGIASKQSQATYNARMRILVSLTSILSWIGFGFAIMNGEYTQEELRFDVLQERMRSLSWSKHLWPILVLNSLEMYWNEHPVRIYSAGLRGSLVAALIVSSQLLSTAPDGSKPFFALSPNILQVSLAIILAVIQILLPRRPDLFTQDGKPVDLENSSSVFQKYSMQWCTTTLRLAGDHRGVDRLHDLDYRTKSKNQGLLSITSSETSLFRLIVVERSLQFIKQWTLMLVRSMVTFGLPYCVMHLLRSLEDRDGTRDDAWLWLIGIGAFSTCQTVINHYLIWIQWSEIGVPIRAQLIMAIFRKIMANKDTKDPIPSGSKASSSKPEAINLISSDTLAFSKFTAVNYIIPASFIRFLFAVLFLWRLLGWQSTIVAITVTALSVPVHMMVIRQERAARKNLSATRDKNTKTFSEALHSLRQIKFSALEAPWEERIDTLRLEEMRHLRRSFIASNIRAVWSVAASFFVAASSICTYAYVKRSISPSVIFPMLEILPHLQGTLGFVPVVFQDYFGAKLNASRMEEFLKLPEQEGVLDSCPSGCISFRNASIAWPSDNRGNAAHQEKQAILSPRFCLQNINLKFPVGELSVICGKTGSGKSLLLAAIIGEVDLLSGRIEAPLTAEGQPIAFVSQTPWLQNDSIKENILFGSPLDKERYEKVMTACALHFDLEALPKGDETRIGLRGVKLSGGQRARVCLGRALYSSAKVIVLDDIFSALDTHVSKEVFGALTGELCENRTVILATHRVSFCSPKAKYLVTINDGVVESTSDFDRTSINDNVVSPQDQNEGNVAEAVRDKVPISKPTSERQNIRQARTDLKVYKSYFAAAGGVGFALIYFLGLITKQSLGVLTTWILGRSNSPRTKAAVDKLGGPLSPNQPSDDLLQMSLFLYLMVSLAAVIRELLFNLHTSSGSISASKAMFKKMVSGVLRMPLIWLDTTPIGEILKRFSVDTRMVDDHVLATVSEFADCLVKLITVICAGLYTSKYTSVLTFALLFWCARVSKGYIRARTTVKRADVEPTARILDHLTTSATGVSTIRAFGAVDGFVEQMHAHVDRLSKARRHFWIFNRWLGLQMSFAGIIFTMGTGIMLLSSNSVIDPSLVGFTLSFSMEFSRAIFKAVNHFGMLETYMDAAGAVIAYSELETEKEGDDEVP